MVAHASVLQEFACVAQPGQGACGAWLGFQGSEGGGLQAVVKAQAVVLVVRLHRAGHGSGPGPCADAGTEQAGPGKAGEGWGAFCTACQCAG